MKGVLHTWLWLLGLALAYFASGQLGLTVPYLGAFVSLIWPPTGVAVAALWRGGLSRWPGVWLGSLAINLASGGTPLMSVAIACGNTLAPLLTVWALRRVGASLHFDTRRDMNHYLLAISGGMLASASVGTLSLWLSGVMQPAQLPKIFLIWWAGDAVGALLLGIPLLTFVPRLWRELSPTRRLEGLGCLAGMLMIGQLLLYSPSHAALLPLVFIPFLLLSWLAVRTGLMLSSLAVLLLSALMAWGTVQGMGPFHRPSVHEGLALLWGYMATLMVVALLLSALVAELSANERRWQFALEGADTGVWDWHARSQRIQYSPRWRMLLGVSAAELGNTLTGWESRVHPDDLPTFIAVLAIPAPLAIAGAQADFAAVRAQFVAAGRLLTSGQYGNESRQVVRMDTGFPAGKFIAQLGGAHPQQHAPARRILDALAARVPIPHPGVSAFQGKLPAPFIGGQFRHQRAEQQRHHHQRGHIAPQQRQAFVHRGAMKRPHALHRAPGHQRRQQQHRQRGQHQPGAHRQPGQQQEGNKHQGQQRRVRGRIQQQLANHQHASQAAQPFQSAGR
jgi:integral membrane sensor domain MASE1